MRPCGRDCLMAKVDRIDLLFENLTRGESANTCVARAGENMHWHSRLQVPRSFPRRSRDCMGVKR